MHAPEHSFEVYWHLVKRKHLELLELRSEKESAHRDYVEAWFEFMAMGHPEALKEDKEKASSSLQSCGAARERAILAVSEAERRLILFEECLRQCTPT